MTHIRWTLSFDDELPQSVSRETSDVDFSLRVYDGQKTVGVLRISVHFPDGDRVPEISVAKGARAKWLDVYDGAFPCWPPVRRQQKPEVKCG